MRFPPSWLDELRARADIVQIVGQYVQLKKNGRKYWGLCPFHGEKTASFSVDPEKEDALRALDVMPDENGTLIISRKIMPSIL